MIELCTPIREEEIAKLQAGDIITISGFIICGRDAALPKLVGMIEAGEVERLGIELRGQVVFHTAVSPAGVGPTSSNKPDIESSIAPLSCAGVKLHLGKGKLHPETIEALDHSNSVYAVIPPVTALLEAKISERRTLAFPELGMEALHVIKADHFPAIVGAAHGVSIYMREKRI